MKRKLFIIGIIATVVAGVVAGSMFYACHKDANMPNSSLKNHKLMAYYDEDLVKQFMEEPLVQELKSCIESFGIKVDNGILHFRNDYDVEVFYDTLGYFSDKWNNLLETNPTKFAHYIESKKFPRYPMLFAFEAITGFHSLRADIENQILALEAGDGIPDEKNPDDHFIVSDHMRTLLTPDCEITAGNIIFLHGKYQYLAIFDLDYDKLAAVKALWKQYGEIDGTVKAIQQSLARLVPMHKADEDYGECANPCANVAIKASLSSSAQCSRTYNLQYTPLFYNPPCMITTVEWNFGDGTTLITGHNGGTKKEYKQAGTYLVTVKLTIANVQTGETTECTASYNLTVSINCEVTINEPIRDNSFGGPGAKYNNRIKYLRI